MSWLSVEAAQKVVWIWRESKLIEDIYKGYNKKLYDLNYNVEDIGYDLHR